MDFINNNAESLNILQEFLNIGCTIYGESVLNILKCKTPDVVKIFIPSEEISVHVENLKATLDGCARGQITSKKCIWLINKLTIMTTTKFPSNIDNNNKNICITKNGISTLDNNNGIEILNILRNVNNKEPFDDTYVNTSLKWIKYFIKENHNIYGSWPSRYITESNPQEMHRDIDICTNNYNSLRNMITLLIDVNVCQLINNNTNKYIDIPFNVEFQTPEGVLKFDIHKESKKMSADAFYNNLKLSQKCLTLNYQPSNINFISALILTFNDLFSNNYTLIEPFPKRVDNISQLRLVIKPLLFSSTHTINYDYLKHHNEKVDELKDILVNKKCYKKCNYPLNNNLGVPSTTVIKLGDKFKCIQCIHNHVLIQKEIQEKKMIGCESDGE